MMSTAGVALALALAGEAPEGWVRSAVERALPLLQRAAEGHARQRTCFACHNQGLPMIAFDAARRKGFRVDDAFLAEQIQHVTAFLRDRQPALEKGSLGGGVDTAGWALYFLAKAQAAIPTNTNPAEPNDPPTQAAVEYLLKAHDNLNGPWRPTSRRPPTQGSLFTSTYVALRALDWWGAAEHQERIARRRQAAREWLVKTPAEETEDQVYRLRALSAAGADADAIREAARTLRQAQRDDGGWGQTPDRPSDPYATATALAALHEIARLPTSSRTFRRGVAYLLLTQQADGSWHLPTRSRPIQTYFESGFPHGKDQFISAAATAWAVTALVHACPAQAASTPPPHR